MLAEYFNKKTLMHSLGFGIGSGLTFAVALSISGGPILLAPMLGLMAAIPYHAGQVSGAQSVLGKINSHSLEPT